MTDIMPLDRQLCFSLYSASLAMTQLYKPLLEPLGLTYPQYLIMLILWEKDGVSLKDIGSRLGQKSGALTPVLKRLEQDGLVKRVRDEKDERALNISLTEKGEALRKPASKVAPCVAEACGMSIPELIDLKAKLEELRKNLLDSQK
ncbi:MarR family transcriptional regulator [uncultured Cohaesibacter sp.]|uniref:MarR family winged helix-turn-helix transcriptional regulator n=1 Tax=uncultured Cohaesibacter sp. TaxID=1002546 RepID=UPI0029C9205F|nr:MarR family transcriptional regulator [uncultured Cohaesibacter sp.]